MVSSPQLFHHFHSVFLLNLTASGQNPVLAGPSRCIAQINQAHLLIIPDKPMHKQSCYSISSSSYYSI